MSDYYQNMQTSDIIVEALIDWGVKVIFGLPGDGINGVMEALRKRQDYSCYHRGHIFFQLSYAYNSKYRD